ncbi:hypothetical protein M8H82_36215, partial [Streptomyces sp. YS415]|nr:hypothetical protein [Streptomyces sp. YS415]
MPGPHFTPLNDDNPSSALTVHSPLEIRRFTHQGEPVTEITLQFHITRPADVTPDHLQQTWSNLHAAAAQFNNAAYRTPAGDRLHLTVEATETTHTPAGTVTPHHRITLTSRTEDTTATTWHTDTTIDDHHHNLAQLIGLTLDHDGHHALAYHPDITDVLTTTPTPANTTSPSLRRRPAISRRTATTTRPQIRRRPVPPPQDTTADTPDSSVPTDATTPAADLTTLDGHGVSAVLTSTTDTTTPAVDLSTLGGEDLARSLSPTTPLQDSGAVHTSALSTQDLALMFTDVRRELNAIQGGDLVPDSLEALRDLHDRLLAQGHVSGRDPLSRRGYDIAQHLRFGTIPRLRGGAPVEPTTPQETGGPSSAGPNEPPPSYREAPELATTRLWSSETLQGISPETRQRLLRYEWFDQNALEKLMRDYAVAPERGELLAQWVEVIGRVPTDIDALAKSHPNLLQAPELLGLSLALGADPRHLIATMSRSERRAYEEWHYILRQMQVSMARAWPDPRTSAWIAAVSAEHGLNMAQLNGLTIALKEANVRPFTPVDNDLIREAADMAKGHRPADFPPPAPHHASSSAARDAGSRHPQILSDEDLALLVTSVNWDLVGHEKLRAEDGDTVRSLHDELLWHGHILPGHSLAERARDIARRLEATEPVDTGTEPGDALPPYRKAAKLTVSDYLLSHLRLGISPKALKRLLKYEWFDEKTLKKFFTDFGIERGERDGYVHWIETLGRIPTDIALSTNSYRNIEPRELLHLSHLIAADPRDVTQVMTRSGMPTHAWGSTLISLAHHISAVYPAASLAAHPRGQAWLFSIAGRYGLDLEQLKDLAQILGTGPLTGSVAVLTRIDDATVREAVQKVKQPASSTPPAALPRSAEPVPTPPAPNHAGTSSPVGPSTAPEGGQETRDAATQPSEQRPVIRRRPVPAPSADRAIRRKPVPPPQDTTPLPPATPPAARTVTGPLDPISDQDLALLLPDVNSRLRSPDDRLKPDDLESLRTVHNLLLDDEGILGSDNLRQRAVKIADYLTSDEIPRLRGGAPTSPGSPPQTGEPSRSGDGWPAARDAAAPLLHRHTFTTLSADFTPSPTDGPSTEDSATDTLTVHSPLEIRRFTHDGEPVTDVTLHLEITTAPGVTPEQLEGVWTKLRAAAAQLNDYAHRTPAGDRLHLTLTDATALPPSGPRHVITLTGDLRDTNATTWHTSATVDDHHDTLALFTGLTLSHDDRRALAYAPDVVDAFTTPPR